MTNTIKLSPKAWDNLLEILDNPPPPTDALRELMEVDNFTNYYRDSDEVFTFDHADENISELGVDTEDGVEYYCHT